MNLNSIIEIKRLIKILITLIEVLYLFVINLHYRHEYLV